MGCAGGRGFTAIPDSAGFSAVRQIRFTVRFRETITIAADRRSLTEHSASGHRTSRDRGDALIATRLRAARCG